MSVQRPLQFTLAIGFCPSEHYVPLARAAEAAGWDSIAVPDGLFWYDQVSVAYPYSEDGSRFWDPKTPFLDPFVVMGVMAAVTERIRFYPSVLKLAVREPLLVAKEVSTCAVLANGRIGLGVGLSPWPEDFEVLRQDWSNRGPRSAEMIEIIRGVMSGELYEFHGRYYDVPKLQIAPVPPGGVPIYIGGLAEPVLKRAARMADGYIGWENPRCRFEEVGSLARRIAMYREEYGTADAPFEFKFLPLSSRAEVVAELQRHGVTDVISIPWMERFGPEATLAQRIESVQRYADEVIAKFR